LILIEKYYRYINFKNIGDIYNINILPSQIVRVSVEYEKSSSLREYNYLMQVKLDTTFTRYVIELWNWMNINNPQRIEYYCTSCENGKILTNCNPIGNVNSFSTLKGSRIQIDNLVAHAPNCAFENTKDISLVLSYYSS
jgi:hypothetical protein